MKKLIVLCLSIALLATFTGTALAIESEYNPESFTCGHIVRFDTDITTIPMTTGSSYYYKNITWFGLDGQFYPLNDRNYPYVWYSSSDGSVEEFDMPADKSATVIASYRLNGGNGNGGYPYYYVRLSDGTYGFILYYGIKPAKRDVVANVGRAGVTVNFYNCNGDLVATKITGSDGKATYTPNDYVLDLDVAVSFAEKHWDITTNPEIVQNNDCATFVSHILTQGGFAVYDPYACESTPPANLGALLPHLTNLGVQIDTNVSWQNLRPGDVVWPDANHGHAMFVAEIDEVRGAHLYAHSTSAKNISELSDNCWVKRSMSAVARTSNYTYTYETVEEASIVINKVDASNNTTPLSGATFELRNSSGTVVRTGTTGSDGTLTFDGLDAGSYTVVEVSPPTNYLMNE